MMSVRHVTRFVYMPGLRVHRQSHVCACVSFWKTLPWCGKKKKGSVILKFLFKFLLLHALLWKLIGMPVWKGSRSNVSFWMEVCEMLKHLKTRFLSSLFFCPRLDDAHRFFFFFLSLWHVLMFYCSRLKMNVNELYDSSPHEQSGVQVASRMLVGHSHFSIFTYMCSG